MERTAFGPAKRNRLIDAIEVVERLPAFVGSRDRLLRALGSNGHAAPGEVAAAIESDPALSMHVLRLAAARSAAGERVDTVPAALERIELAELREIGAGAPTFDVLTGAPLWGPEVERFRMHGLAVQQVAVRIARETHPAAVDRIMVAALLHDAGKLVLVAAHAQHPDRLVARPASPEERLRLELRTFGMTHAMAGGVLARRWRLAPSLEAAIARHHEPSSPDAAIVQLADFVVHHTQGRPVDRAEVVGAAERAGVGRAGIRRLFGSPTASSVPRRADPSPLSAREAQALRGLSRGQLYKEIATDLGLSVSTVRSHLSTAYDKLGARDRAQAVLIATDRGWL